MEPVFNPFAGDRYTDSWERLVRLRRRWVRSFLIFVGTIVIAFALRMLLGGGSEIVLFAAVLIAMPAWAIGVFTQIQLNGFRCPSCGRRFVLTLFSNWPWRKRCPHCGIEVPPKFR